MVFYFFLLLYLGVNIFLADKSFALKAENKCVFVLEVLLKSKSGDETSCFCSNEIVEISILWKEERIEQIV